MKTFAVVEEGSMKKLVSFIIIICLLSIPSYAADRNRKRQTTSDRYRYKRHPQLQTEQDNKAPSKDSIYWGCLLSSCGVIILVEADNSYHPFTEVYLGFFDSIYFP